MSVAFVVPAHNEAATIGSVVRSLCSYGHVIVVDDASGDDTAEFARAAGAEVVTHPANLGYERALETGFAHAAANYAVIVTFDADGQHDVGSLCAILPPLIENRADLVIGIRPAAARLGEALFNLYARIHYGIPDILCGLKGYRTELYRTHGHFDRIRGLGTELALASMSRGARWQTVSVPIHPRYDSPRMGSRFRTNCRLLAALLRAFYTSLAGWPPR
jgi:glycosyltransferase involved in cell wall biosynthesis